MKGQEYIKSKFKEYRRADPGIKSIRYKPEYISGYAYCRAFVLVKLTDGRAICADVACDPLEEDIDFAVREAIALHKGGDLKHPEGTSFINAEELEYAEEQIRNAAKHGNRTPKELMSET